MPPLPRPGSLATRSSTILMLIKLQPEKMQRNGGLLRVLLPPKTSGRHHKL